MQLPRKNSRKKLLRRILEKENTSRGGVELTGSGKLCFEPGNRGKIFTVA